MEELAERIVREVLARLAEQPAAAPVAAPAERAASCPRPAADELVLSERVVTLAALAGRLDSLRRLVVSQRAIVTPAVRDELLRRNIALSFASVNGHANVAAATAGLRLMVVVHADCCDAAALALANVSAAVAIETDDCVIAASDRLAAAARKENTLGVLVTRYAPAALCLLNRLPQVRAIHATDPAKVSAAAAAVGANVLVVDTEAGGLYRVRRAIGEFCRGGVRKCPKVFAARLN